MRPVVWRPPVETSPAEQAVIKAVRRAKLFVFLRQHRHELFDEEFQAELAETYVDSPKGQPPVPPARLALATILQAYTGASDDEVIEAAVMDRRWQLVLDCMDAGEPPFSKGTLVGFRKRLIEDNLDRRLIERTVELAAATKGFGARALRAALDSSPLWGAGRVEDTFNLMGHALRKALGVIAVLQGRGQAAGTAIVAAQAGVPALAASSLKAALDRDWDDPAARDQALAQVLGLLERVEAFIAGQAGQEAAAMAVRVACQVRDQDVDCSGPAPGVCQIFCARGFSLSGSGCLSVTIFSRYLMSCCPVYPAVPRNRTFRAVPGLMLRVPVFPASCAVAGACCLILRGSHGGPFPSVIKYSRR